METSEEAGAGTCPKDEINHRAIKLIAARYLDRTNTTSYRQKTVPVPALDFGGLELYRCTLVWRCRFDALTHGLGFCRPPPSSTFVTVRPMLRVGDTERGYDTEERVLGRMYFSPEYV